MFVISCDVQNINSYNNDVILWHFFTFICIVNEFSNTHFYWSLNFKENILIADLRSLFVEFSD